MPSRKKPAFESIDWDKVDMADLDSDLDEDENENKPVDMMQKYLDSLNPGLKLTCLLFPLCCFMQQCCECVRLELMIFTALFLAEVKERERKKEEETLMKKQKREKHKAKGPWDDWIALNWMDWFTLGIIILQVRFFFFFLMRTFELSSFSPSSFRFWCVPSPRSKSRFRSRPYTTSSITQRSSPA